MASGNKPGQPQNPGQGQPKQNGPQSAGLVQGATDRLRDVGQNIQEGASQVGDRLREGYGNAREGAAHVYRRAEGTVARNPGSSVLVGFGLGFGLGVLLTAILSQREEETWYDRHVPDRFRHFPDSFRHLADALKNVPEAVARHIPSR